MFHRRCDDVTFARARHQRAVNRRVVALRAATGEHHFARISVDERGHPGAGLFDRLGHFIAKRVSARWVSPTLGQKRKHRLHDFRSDPCRGIVIEITDLLPAHVSDKSKPETFTLDSRCADASGQSPENDRHWGESSFCTRSFLEQITVKTTLTTARHRW